jgi:acylphosphatase
MQLTIPSQAEESMPDKVRVRVIVGGLVQGIFFRSSTHQMAAGLGLDGWVRNLPDGRVEAVFEGDRESVDQALAWIAHGPPRAVVDSVERFNEAPSGLLGFRVMQ